MSTDNVKSFPTPMRREKRSTPQSLTSASILVYGSDELLLGTRDMVLEQAGYRVFTAVSVSALEEVIMSQTISLLVLCHSLASDKCAAALKIARSKHPEITSLVLIAGMSPCADPTPGAVLSAFDGPRKLVVTVQDLLHDVLGS